MVGSTTLYDGLYKIDLLPTSDPVSSSVSVVNVVVGSKHTRSNETSSMWHKRLGHIFRERMERLIKDSIPFDLSFLILKLVLLVSKGNFQQKLESKRLAKVRIC